MRGQLLDYISQASELTFCVRVIISYGMEKGGEDLFFIFMAVLIDI